jgi:hypothetical protein
VLTHRRCLMSLIAKATVSSTALVPALAFDDREFCVATQQLALAVNKDVGLWIDRITRNDGVVVACSTRIVEFKRFITAPLASRSEDWKERKAAEWNATHCNNPIWIEAIRNGWMIAATFTALDGGRISLRAQCK